MVQDLQTEQKWYFLCNSWLAIDIGDCSLDKVFPVSSEMDLKRFRYSKSITIGENGFGFLFFFIASQVSK